MIRSKSSNWAQRLPRQVFLKGRITSHKFISGNYEKYIECLRSIFGKHALILLMNERRGKFCSKQNKKNMKTEKKLSTIQQTNLWTGNKGSGSNVIIGKTSTEVLHQTWLHLGRLRIRFTNWSCVNRSGVDHCISHWWQAVTDLTVNVLRVFKHFYWPLNLGVMVLFGLFLNNVE